MLRAALLAFALLSAAPVAAEGEDHAEHASAHEHGGPLHIGDVLRLDNAPFWAAVLNFSLLAYVLRRLGKKPLAEMLVSRRRQMEQAMTEAASMKQKAEAKYDEYNKRLATLDQELGKLRSDIERAAQEDKQRIVADAEETAHRLKRETESLIEQYGKALGGSLRREMVEAAVGAAEKLLRDALTEADQQRLAQSYSEQVQNPAPRGRALQARR